MNQIVWPYASGEVIVQNYNAVLSLSRLSKASDGVLLIENDAMHDICSRKVGMKNISTDEINREIARHLAGFLCPAHTVTPNDTGGAVISEHCDGGL